MHPLTALRTRPRLAVLATFTLMGAVAAFGHELLLHVDRPLSSAVRGQDLAEAFRSITTLGGTELAIGLVAATSAVLWRRCRLLAIAYPVTLVVGAVLNVVLKSVIGRPRPPLPDTGVALASFPSGHTLQVTLLFGLLPLVAAAFTIRRPVIAAVTAASATVIAAVGLSRIYLGAHWPTDVVGGVLLGAAMIWITTAVVDVHRTAAPDLATCACRSGR